MYTVYHRIDIYIYMYNYIIIYIYTQYNTMMWICVVHVDCTILRCCTVLRHFILLLDLPGFRIDVLILGLKQNLGIHLSTIFRLQPISI